MRQQFGDVIIVLCALILNSRTVRVRRARPKILSSPPAALILPSEATLVEQSTEAGVSAIPLKLMTYQSLSPHRITFSDDIKVYHIGHHTNPAL